MFLPGEPNEPSITERTVPEQANKVTHLEFALLINLPSSLYISVQYIYIYMYMWSIFYCRTIGIQCHLMTLIKLDLNFCAWLTEQNCLRRIYYAHYFSFMHSPDIANGLYCWSVVGAYYYYSMVLMFHSNLNDETQASPVRKVSRMHASSIMSFSPQNHSLACSSPSPRDNK
jgi:hypothetical protein